MRVVNNRCCKDRACWFIYDEVLTRLYPKGSIQRRKLQMN